MRIGIIGHFGADQNFNDGQTVKIQALYNGLNKELNGSIKIDKVDTYYIKSNKPKLFIQFFKCLLLDKKIIFLPGANGREVLFRFMYYLGKITRKEIYHDCIGGRLIKEIEAHKGWVKYLSSYKGNWMESAVQVKNLQKMGIDNALYLPNFKPITPNSIDMLPKTEGDVLRFCTFSRVLPEKGIEEAVLAVKKANEKMGCLKGTIDIYGPIQKDAEEWFHELVENNKDICRYCGSVPSDTSVEVLTPYFALLFPTRFFTEGMPGTIIDAMFAGIPVIARRWIYCDEMIINGYNGISYDFETPEKIDEIIYECVNNPEILTRMKENCIREAAKYTEETVIAKIRSEMNI